VNGRANGTCNFLVRSHKRGAATKQYLVRKGSVVALCKRKRVMKKAILSVLLLSAVCASPASANYFSNPITGTQLNIGSAPNPTPSMLRLLGESRTVVAENVLPPAPPPPAPPVYAPPPPPAPPAFVPAPPPPPPAPIVTPREFMVFFDFDRSTLSPEAREIVAKAVSAAMTTGSVHIAVTGHTDTVGSRSYNQRLSERRAMAVKAEMIRDGFSGTMIATAGRNFSDPLVPTGPGVREPQNRRAVIDLGQPAVAMLDME
jgi:outer membrane protein OmpA-like peptidoglycan-associated protein